MNHREQEARYQQRAASEARIERLADRLVKQHSLDTKWDCEDALNDCVFDVVRTAAREEGLDDCQESYLKTCIMEAVR